MESSGPIKQFTHKLILFLVVVGCCFTSIWYTQRKINNVYDEASNNELLYFPNDKLLKHFTAGMNNVVADILWLKTIQYMAQEFNSQDHKFMWLDHMCTAVTSLDPHFEDAWVTGGTFMASIGSDDKALAYLKKGAVQNPNSYQIPYEMAKVYLLNRKDDPEAPVALSHYIRMAGERHKPEYRERFFRWSNKVLEENDLAGEAYAIWKDVLDNETDPFLRQLAQTNLDNVVANENLKRMNKMIEQYQTAQGHKPTHLEQLVEKGLLAEIPNQPVDGAYYIHNGSVYHTVLQETLRQGMIVTLNMEITKFKHERNRLPRSLTELEEFFGGTMPEYPHPDKQWGYDPATGTIS
jgi:hypothetical protein